MDGGQLDKKSCDTPDDRIAINIDDIIIILC